MNVASIETILRTVLAVLAGLMFALTFALALAGFCKWSHVRLKAAVRKCGPFAFGFFLVWGVLLADSQNMTQEEKEDAIEQEEEDDEENTLLGGILLGRPMLAGSRGGSDDDDIAGVHAMSDSDEPVTIWGLAAEGAPSVRAPTDSDYAAGLALTAIGTGETFDFTPPEGAAVYEPWMRFGAARHWFRSGTGDQGSGERDGGCSFPFGTNVIDALTVFSDGLLRLKTKDAGSFLAPFHADLCLAPAYWWEQLENSFASPSRFWSAQTSLGGRLFTWENALLDRDSSKPVSFQVEISSDGTVDFRYDLSRLDASDLTNLLVGVGFEGSGRVFNELLSGTTSLKWRRLDPLRAEDPDPDGDGITTADEIVLTQTDPYSPDTDQDGISDYDEINETNSDPTDPRSVNPAYPDGFAVVLGEEDPFAYPEGSTNTVLEHVFYTGTTNAPFAYPVPDGSTAVLEVTVSGTGSGELVIGDKVVPLLSRPRLLMGANGLSDPTATTLRVAVPKGTIQNCFLRIPESLEVAITSSDFVYGQHPTFLHPRGWFAFPNTTASHPCIHDLNLRSVDVSLDPGFAAPGLSCVWNSTASVGAVPTGDLSATLFGHFSPSSTAPVTYTLSHPLYICGRTNYTQTARYCPQVDDDSVLPEGDGERSDEEYDRHLCGDLYEHSGCMIPNCDCPCHLAGLPSTDSDCDVHHCAYSECESLHRAAYENTCALPLQAGLLFLGREPPYADSIDLEAPPPGPQCCLCPDHHLNPLALAAKSFNLAVRDAAGEKFVSTNADCTVSVHGLSPSRAIGDSVAIFCKTGVVSEADIHRYTVLGVRIESDDGDVDVKAIERQNSDFGFPVVIKGENPATYLRLNAAVRLPDGDVHLAFTNATARFRLTIGSGSDELTLLDTDEKPTLDLSLLKWRSIAAMTDYGDGAVVKLYASGKGHVDLDFGYAMANGQSGIRDSDRLRITAINPPLLPDYNRDGVVDGTDVSAYGEGRALYFWKNEDTWSGDDAFEPYGDLAYKLRPIAEQLSAIKLPLNNRDSVVNGRNDLVNLCPFAVDLYPLMEAWGTTDIEYELYVPEYMGFSFVLIRTKWDEFGTIVNSDQKTYDSDDLHSADLLSSADADSSDGGYYALPSGFVELGRNGAGALDVEFHRAATIDLRTRVRRKSDGRELFSSSVNVHVCDVHDMYRWINLDPICGADTDSKYADRTWVEWPDYEHADANVVFVHGYNVHEDEAWDWSQAMFKRLWWSGMDAGFTAVLWKGNYSQMWLPLVNTYGTINYHQNVLNAFRTASALKTASDSLPGARKYYIAHSLGNMLVSAAKQDYGLEYEKYMMLNAAVPIEAYDPEGGITAESKFVQTPPVWRDYPDRVRSTHWHDLFPDGDARQMLTWSNRFANVDNTINFYSSKDEVVANGDGGWKLEVSRKYAWYNQERKRGKLLVSASPQAGWNFNDWYSVETVAGFNQDGVIMATRRYTPDEAAAISEASLKIHPFFRDFRDTEIYGEGGSEFVRTNDFVRWYALSHGIPAESFAAGANPVPKWGIADDEDDSSQSVQYQSDRNVNMATDCNPAGPAAKPLEWIHSYFIQKPLRDTKILYEKLVNVINGRNTGGGE